MDNHTACSPRQSQTRGTGLRRGGGMKLELAPGVRYPMEEAGPELGYSRSAGRNG